MNGIRTLGYLTLDAGPLETIEAAASAGFTSVGIRITGRRPADPFPPVVGNKHMIRAIRNALDEHGMALSNISAYHFYPDITPDSLARVMETIAELGPRIVVANSYDPDEGSFIDRLGPYCELARANGIKVAVEFMRYSEVKTLQDTLRVIEQTGASNLGILADSLHLARSGGTPAELGAIDPRLVLFAQVCDAKQQNGELTDLQLRHEARTGRLFPGDGVLPLREFVAALPAGTEIEYEVPRAEFGLLTLSERAKVAFSVFENFLATNQAVRNG